MVDQPGLRHSSFVNVPRICGSLRVARLRSRSLRTADMVSSLHLRSVSSPAVFRHEMLWISISLGDCCQGNGSSLSGARASWCGGSDWSLNGYFLPMRNVPALLCVTCLLDGPCEVDELVVFRFLGGTGQLPRPVRSMFGTCHSFIQKLRTVVSIFSRMGENSPKSAGHSSDVAMEGS